MVNNAASLCTPLFTKTKLEIVTVKLGADILFSTNRELGKVGVQHIRRTSMDFRNEYGQWYKD